MPCWFCRRVLARSIGNTHVTPTRPATPPLISLAGRLRKGSTQTHMHAQTHLHRATKTAPSVQMTHPFMDTDADKWKGFFPTKQSDNVSFLFYNHIFVGLNKQDTYLTFFSPILIVFGLHAQAPLLFSSCRSTTYSSLSSSSPPPPLPLFGTRPEAVTTAQQPSPGHLPGLPFMWYRKGPPPSSPCYGRGGRLLFCCGPQPPGLCLLASLSALMHFTAKPDLSPVVWTQNTLD